MGGKDIIIKDKVIEWAIYEAQPPDGWLYKLSDNRAKNDFILTVIYLRLKKQLYTCQSNFMHELGNEKAS